MSNEIGITKKGLPNRRHQAKAATRQKVLDAARTLFLEKGYDLTTIRDIAKCAGMSTGAVFANFKDKTELFLAVMEEGYRPYRQIQEEMSEQGIPAADQILAMFETEYMFYLENLLLMSRLADMEARNVPGVRDFVNNMRLCTLHMLDRAIRPRVESTTTPEQKALFIEMLWSVHLGNCHRAAVAEWEPTKYLGHVAAQIDMITKI